jgi:hypothetical protein
MTPLAPQHVPTFVLAGHSRFIIRSRKTSAEMALGVNYAPKRRVYYVSVYTNGRVKKHNSIYVGTYFPEKGTYKHSAKSKIPPASDVAQGVKWFFDNYLFAAEAKAHALEVLHVGRCGRCGRPLKGEHANGLGDHCTELITEQLTIILPS